MFSTNNWTVINQRCPDIWTRFHCAENRTVPALLATTAGPYWRIGDQAFTAIIVRCLTVMLLIGAAPVSMTTVVTADTLKFDPDTGYRIGQYRAPTPAEADGGKRIDIEQLKQLTDNQAVVLVDVMSAEGLGPDPIDGQWIVSKPRHHLPGSVWLPEVGRGTLDDVMSHYFKSQLKELTNARMDTPIVFYCVADCWMSWNATRRAAQWGYTRAFWYSEGTDGWVEHDLPLVPATPVPVPITQSN